MKCYLGQIKASRLIDNMLTLLQCNRTLRNVEILTRVGFHGSALRRRRFIIAAGAELRSKISFPIGKAQNGKPRLLMQPGFCFGLHSANGGGLLLK